MVKKLCRKGFAIPTLALIISIGIISLLQSLTITQALAFSPDTDRLPTGWVWNQNTYPCASVAIEPYCYKDTTGKYQHGIAPNCTAAYGRPDNCGCTPGNSNCAGTCTQQSSSLWLCKNAPVDTGTNTTNTGTTNTATKKPLNSLCQNSSECETGFCDTKGVAYAYDTNTQYGYCHVRPTPTNTPTPTTIPQSANSTTTCSSNGIKSYTYDRTGCFSSRDAKAVTVICNDGTTKNITSSFGCTDTWRLDGSAQNFCSTHKTCPTPTPTNTPIPTNTPTPISTNTSTDTNPTPVLTPLCNPDTTGASATKIDDLDFVWWVSELKGTMTSKNADCITDSKIDIFDFNKMRDTRKARGW